MTEINEPGPDTIRSSAGDDVLLIADCAEDPDPEPGPHSAIVVDVSPDAGNWSTFGPVTDLVERAVAVLARHPVAQGIIPATAAISLSDDSSVRDLNRRFRGKDQPTNVLSFPTPDSLPPHPGEAMFLGDIILAEETVSREAQEQQKKPADHLQHLVIHGLLHLIGLDHETDTEADEMEAVEIELLQDLGISDPYRET